MDTWERTQGIAKECQDKQAGAPKCLGPPQCLQDAREASAVHVLRDTGQEQVLRSVRASCLGTFWTTEFLGSLPGPARCEEGRYFLAYIGVQHLRAE